MFKISRNIVLCTFFTTLLACGGGGSGGGDNGSAGTIGSASAFSVPGDSRLARVERTSSAGDVLVVSYVYADDGRIQEIEGVNNGELLFTLLYTYEEDGRPLARVQDRAAVVQQDTIREYVYDGDRTVGYFLSDLGEDRPRGVMQFQYVDNQIVRTDFKDLDPLIENPTLEDGTLSSFITLTIADSGNVTSLSTQNADGSNLEVTSYVTNASGQRISDQTVDSDFNVIFSSVWEYEAAPCIEFPQSTLSQWLCVQTR